MEVIADDQEIADRSTVQIGTKLSINAIPGDGMMLRSLTINGFDFINGNDYEVYANTEICAEFTPEKGLPYYLDAAGRRIFIGFAYDINGDGDISAGEYLAPVGTKIEDSENSRSFSDIAGHWAEDSINFVTAREIFLGTSATTFDPNQIVTRAMFVTVLGRLYERSYGEIRDPEKRMFTDCDYNSYYGKYVDWATSLGIIKGYGGGLFGPDNEINREQMATLIYNYARVLRKVPYVMDKTLYYTDAASISTWAFDGAIFCQTTQLIRGRIDGSFAPKENATRAETAAILARIIQYVMAE